MPSPLRLSSARLDWRFHPHPEGLRFGSTEAWAASSSSNRHVPDRFLSNRIDLECTRCCLRACTIVCRLNPVSNSRKASGISTSCFLSCSSAIPVSEPYRTSAGISVLMSSFCSEPRSVSFADQTKAGGRHRISLEQSRTVGSVGSTFWLRWRRKAICLISALKSTPTLQRLIIDKSRTDESASGTIKVTCRKGRSTRNTLGSCSVDCAHGDAERFDGRK